MVHVLTVVACRTFCSPAQPGEDSAEVTSYGPKWARTGLEEELRTLSLITTPVET